VDHIVQVLQAGILADRGCYLTHEATIRVNYVPTVRHHPTPENLLSCPKDEPHTGGKPLIDQKKEGGCDEYHGKDHRRRDHGFLAARPGDPRDLLADLLDKLGGARLCHAC